MPRKIKNQPDEITLAHEQKAFELRSQGFTQQSIAQHMNLTQSGISRILTRVNKKYTKLFMNHVADIKAEQVSIHNKIVEEALAAWQLSKGVHTTNKNKFKGIPIKDGKTLKTIGADQSEETKQLFGDTKYLDSSMKAMEHIRKIVGIGQEDEEAERDPIFGEVVFKIVDKRSIAGDEGAKGDI